MRVMPPLGRKRLEREPPKGTFRDYLFLDRERIDSYVDQLGGLISRRSKVATKLSISIKGPSIETSEEDLIAAPSYHEKINFLLDKLWRRNCLKSERLATAPMWGTGMPSLFFLEETVATPITIPKNQLSPELGLAAFKIWISDPNPTDLNGPEWSFRGSFLYLTELVFDNILYQSVWSGCSALRFIANATIGVPFLERSGLEGFGRDSADHPIDKLRPLGAVKGDPRRIETLYRIRYMTDEQVYTYQEQEHRVHDILGYPIYIAAR